LRAPVLNSITSLGYGTRNIDGFDYLFADARLTINVTVVQQLSSVQARLYIYTAINSIEVGFVDIPTVTNGASTIQTNFESDRLLFPNTNYIAVYQITGSCNGAPFTRISGILPFTTLPGTCGIYNLISGLAFVSDRRIELISNNSNGGYMGATVTFRPKLNGLTRPDEFDLIYRNEIGFDFNFDSNSTYNFYIPDNIDISVGTVIDVWYWNDSDNACMSNAGKLVPMTFQA
jgi:hypothetical protein